MARKQLQWMFIIRGTAVSNHFLNVYRQKSMVKVTKNNYTQNRYFHRVREAVTVLLETKGFAAPLEVFVKMELLSEKDVQSWRQGKVRCLERVIQCNLSKVSQVMKVLRCHAEHSKLRTSKTIYKRKGKLLQFSKSGKTEIEESYSTHYLLPR